MSKNNSLYFYILFILFVFLTNNGTSLVFAQKTTVDTIKTYQLKEFEVKGNRLRTVRSVLPLQYFSQKEILKINAINVADVVNNFSGVTLKDYGGIGGMKTVSVRGMDANYTSVSYDGVMLSNIQSGQIDLGTFAVNNIGEISLTNGHPNDFLQSARLFSNANVLNIKSLLPSDNLGDKFGGKAYVKTGSFGLINPGWIVMKNIGKKTGVTFSADLITANGEYNFVQNYGTSAKDSSAVLRRKNSDVHSIRSELNINYRPSQNEDFLFKTNLFLSKRGLPGSVTFYNENASKERLENNNLFTQIQYKNRNQKKFQYSLTARHHYSRVHYTDEDKKYADSDGLLSHQYTQNEYYTSAVAASNISDNLILSGAVDIWMNELDIVSNVDFRDFAKPKRYTTMSNIAIKYVTNRFVAGANLLHTATFETVKTGPSAKNRSKFSPTINCSFQPWENKEYRIRAFYKNLYRLPTFNELYYQEMGNANLLPENANLINVGFTITEQNIFEFINLTLTADAYRNMVKDKIIMLPRNGFYWSMRNRGKVKIWGIDANIKTDILLNNKRELSIRANYSFQRAKDKTPESDNFGEQIPYTPIHSGSTSVSYALKNWEAGYNLLFSGVRWIGQITEKRNKMTPYNVHSAYLQTNYKKWQIRGEVLNLYNTQYEIVKFYPMPRRNLRLSLTYRF